MKTIVHYYVKEIDEYVESKLIHFCEELARKNEEQYWFNFFGKTNNSSSALDRVEEELSDIYIPF